MLLGPFFFRSLQVLSFRTQPFPLLSSPLSRWSNRSRYPNPTQRLRDAAQNSPPPTEPPQHSRSSVITVAIITRAPFAASRHRVIQHHHPPTPTTEIDILQPNLSRRWFSHRRAYIGIGDGDRDGCCRESIPSSCASAEAREPRPSQRERSDAASSAWRSRPPPHLPLFAQQWPR